MNSNTSEFDKNNIKNYTSKDKDYYRIYMKERYQNNTCKKVDCDVCGKSVIYASIARHKKSDKCKNSSVEYQLSINERFERLEKMLSRFSSDFLDRDIVNEQFIKDNLE